MVVMLVVLFLVVVFYCFGGVIMSNLKLSLFLSFVCFVWCREIEVDIDVGIDEKLFVYC